MPVHVVCDVIEEVCGAQSVRPALAAKFAGRLNFAASQLTGALWDGRCVSPHGEVNNRSRFARVVLVDAGARVTAQKRFAANWQQP